DINNEYSETVTVLPITSASMKKVYPFEVFLPKGSGRLPKDSKVKADQIRTLDKGRLVKRIGKLEHTLMTAIEGAIKIHLGLD
ncbi:MAG: type II toxin-antitoxin system PemK/MazF family toxin, partial [Acidobacteriota bacterium]